MDMATEVHIFSADTIQKMKEFYHKEITAAPQGAVFQAKTKDAVVTAYKSGKVMFQGKSPVQELQQWESEMKSVAKTAKSAPSNKYAHTRSEERRVGKESRSKTEHE